MISAPPIDGSSSDLCDWIELAALASASGRVSLSDVNLELEIWGDYEPEDISEEDEIRERRIQQVVNAVHERMAAARSAYPFELNGNYLQLTDASDGGDAYLFCLIVSNAASGGLLHEDGPWKPDLKEARTLFQACATVCASGFASGPSFSVGWPRSDSSSFVDKLQAVYRHRRDGKPHAKIPPWAPPKVKDDEIDVIAWKREPDGLAGSLYLLAQAASGANWREKSLKAAVDTFHTTWFLQAPATHPSPGLIMPFYVSSPWDADEEDFQSQERIEGEYWRTVKEMGVLLSRFRVAHYVDEAVRLSKAGVSPIEEIDKLPEVRAWVNNYRVVLQEADEALR